ncbi:MAG: hypothetical protein RLZZ305_1180 [Actinomycetota bacterium]
MKQYLPRIAVVAAALAAAGAVALIALARGPVAAFSVNGDEWSRDEVHRVVDSLVKAGQITAANGKVTGDDIAAVMSVLVQYSAGRQLLAERGVTLPQDALTTARQQYGAAFTDPFVAGVFADMSVTGKVITSLPAPQDMKSIYEDRPALTGVLCAVDVTLPSESAARAVLGEIDAGGDVLAIAREKSVNKDLEATDGVLALSADTPCAGLSWVKDKVSAPVLEELIATGAGKRSSVVRDAAGWHVLANRPWSEVSGAHAAVFSKDPGRNLAVGFTATADVTVASEYGTWDRASQTIK